MVLSKAKLGKDTFRLARVVALHPDEDAVVRTVTVMVKSRRVRGKALHKEELRMPVQRLVVLLAAGEAWESAVSSES